MFPDMSVRDIKNLIRNTCTADTAKNLKDIHTHLKFIIICVYMYIQAHMII